jgi:hypothetical protein
MLVRNINITKKNVRHVGKICALRATRVVSFNSHTLPSTTDLESLQ